MIAIVIPSYKVKNNILKVLDNIKPQFADIIFVVDDACPEQSGKFVQENCYDKRVRVLYNPKNLGVGGAVKTGYKAALDAGAQIIIKLDGDGQMDPALIPELIKPILLEEADYVKGNRFFNIEGLSSMPKLRLLGNSILSFVNKFVSGYWNIMDPTNGYTAIHRKALSRLPLNKIENRYFFESDMLFRLGTIRAVVSDMPMEAVYADEKSNLQIKRILFEFPPKYLKRLTKRIFYTYFLRDFSVVSINLIVGFILFFFGLLFGTVKWFESMNSGIIATPGTVMLSALPIIIGFQLLLNALSIDIQNVPSKPLLK